MSLIVDNLSYGQAIRSIRELVLDIVPVQCFKVSGQDFVFSKSDTSISLEAKLYDFTEVQKVYDLMRKIRSEKTEGNNLAIEILPNFVSTEYCENIVNFIHVPTADAEDIESVTVEMENYFSDHTIETLLEEFFSYYFPYTGTRRTVEKIYGDMDYFGRRKIVFWVAYYLIDRKRMNYASSNEIINASNPDGSAGCSGVELKNKSTTITTRVGEVFTVSEKDGDNGQGMDGFTDFWGDQYGYFTKLQLWIRDRFEKQFNDFSLRDDAMISQSFFLEKGWEPSAWVDTINYSRSTIDIIHPDYRI